jgi:carbonic anhydrase
VPPCETDTSYHGTSAALAFAVMQLAVRNILVLGHAQCGGVAAALDPKLIAGVPFLEHWVELLTPAREHSAHIDDPHARHVAMERDCVRLTLDNLMTFPFVAARVQSGTLALHGARFGIADGQLEILDPATGDFVPVSP